MALADCEACPKPDGLHQANHTALDCWQIVMHDEHSPTMALQVVAGVGGTKDDLDKLLTIIQLFRELNPNHGRQSD